MIRVADYVFATLRGIGVRHVFLVTGGGAMHLNDALARCEGVTYVCCHHEQACTMAAEAYARIDNELGVASVTSGPGGINALNGVFGAWTDSIPMLVISGQMKRETLMRHRGELGHLRQLGDQEVDIESMVKGITKYVATVCDAKDIRLHLEKAIFLAKSGRPGPCWIDIPLDVQAELIDPDQLVGFVPEGSESAVSDSNLQEQAKVVARKMISASRPVLLGGTGIRLANAIDEFIALGDRLDIPITTAWTHDLIHSSHRLFCGRQGTIGTRAGNFTVQNSDAVLIVGSRMCIRQISYNWKSFAREAYKMQVDIDPSELDKPTFKADLPVCCDAKRFLQMVLDFIPEDFKSSQERQQWLGWCKAKVDDYPSVLPKQRVSEPGTINAYHFVELLFQCSDNGDIFACGDATACITPFQAGILKPGQRLFSNSGSASMGYDLPAAIGAAFAAPENRVICLAGDGSIQMNIQELATIAHNKLPIKIFVLANGGYLSIRSTQANFFKQLIGEGPESGVGFPDFAKVAEGYGVPSVILDTDNAKTHLQQILNSPGPMLTVVELDRSQAFEPKLSSKRLPDGTMVTAPLEDMAPFLERDEFLKNMIIKPVS